MQVEKYGSGFTQRYFKASLDFEGLHMGPMWPFIVVSGTTCTVHHSLASHFGTFGRRTTAKSDAPSAQFLVTWMVDPFAVPQLAPLCVGSHGPIKMF